MPYTAPWVQPVYPSTALLYTSGSRHLSCCFSEIPMTFWPQDLCTSSPCLWPDSIYYVFVSLLPRLLDWKLHECIYVCTCACVYVKHSLPYTQYLGQWLACRRCSVEDLPRARLSQQRAQPFLLLGARHLPSEGPASVLPQLLPLSEWVVCTFSCGLSRQRT